ncbi:hypothetical protein IG197_05815 [Aminobacter sp. SR38]|jgi:hypothetical protein|uniref:hypothetical protein n=1 Tax=Aminobacter sp. SR38 TaxID=2774562 RepID=UPI00177DB28A|nr:hypothetical protein [Aminobacter sp. SR38]QOF72589.1 hypothetical protein IG197_05815 [Aminobacter sp. SR38]
MHEIPDNIFDTQQMLAELVKPQAESFGTIFRPYDIRTSVAAAGGLLTLPELQANAVRLEATAHLIVASAAGKKKPSKQDAARWFRQVGQAFAHMEDAAEDVFVGRVHIDGRNYRVLEGLAEANCHYLQQMLTAVESMPDRGVYAALKQSCHAMLALSDLVCARSGLEAFCRGGEYGLDALPVSDLPTIETLAARVTFSDGDLAQAGVSRRALGRFCLPPSQRDVGFGGYGDSWLERQPLIDFQDVLLVALPSSIGTAIRRAVIETCRGAGAEFALWTALLIAQTEELSLNPAISALGIPPTKMKRDSYVVPSEPVEFQPGLWFHLVLLTDDFAGFNETGFSRPGPSSEKTQAELQQAIDAAAADTKARPGFKLGFSLIVFCGFGRGQLIEFARPAHWLAEGISSYDLDVLGWRHDFNIAELLKFLIAEGTAGHMGFPLMAINGLLARIGFAYENNGHVVPHEAMPDGAESATLIVPTNAHLRLRAEHHARFDKHAVRDVAGNVLVVRRKDGGKRSPENTQRVYVSHLDARVPRYRGVWRSGSRTWWLETVPLDERSYLYPIFEMQMVWMEGLAPILAEHVPGLPDVLTWKLVTPAYPAIRSKEINPPPLEELKGTIRVSYDPDGCVVSTEIGLPFFQGLSHPSNVSEVALIEGFLEQVVTLASGADVDRAALLREIIPSPEARQLHAFAPQDFRDYVHESVPGKVVKISSFDDAALRLGLGWHGLPRPGGTVKGRDECTRVLNAITVAAEEMFCEHLRQFERHALIRRVVENHEASIADKSRWERTSGAVLDLSANPQESRDEVSKSIQKANATGLASRIILEAALCESPIGVGFEVADFDLSNLMALAMMIHHLGGYSDAIRYEGMRPEMRISPAGEVQIDVSFFDAIVRPVGESFVSVQIDRSRRDYSELLQEPELLTEEQATSRTNTRFAAAWEAEMGISLREFRAALEVLENRLVETGQAWEVLPRPALIQYLSEHIDCAEQFVGSLELLPRHGWKNIPQPYADQDRQPWRFRRRLSVARRPILRLEPSTESDVVIAPGMIRDAFSMLLHNFYYGHYDLNSIASKEMRSWREHIVAEEAAEFEERVVTRLQELGWQAKRGAKFSHILGRKLPEDPGDIDVLAWHTDGRVMLLECKDLQFAKTSSEIAKQLHKFRGKTDEKGRPDLLGKHLRRMVLARENAAAFQSHLKLADIRIDGALVFAHTVPMSFAAERIGHAVALLTYDQLESVFGGLDGA